MSEIEAKRLAWFPLDKLKTRAESVLCLNKSDSFSYLSVLNVNPEKQ